MNDIRVGLPAGYAARLGVAYFPEVAIGDTPPGLLDEISQLCGDYLARGVDMPEDFVKGVRALLRQGGFKPSGRNRPASEYLIRDLIEEREFKYINNLVDINNLLSLRHFLPMTVLDAAKFQGALELRVGREDEAYVFNQSGQELDLTGLIVAADATEGESRAMGSPIKDSQFAKLAPETQSAVAVVYSHPRLTSEAQMELILAQWCDLARKHAGARASFTRVLTAE